ncbi:hypothetical protein M8J76_007931 [Diaphorina citri]|nr:hypothetical protein M8J75_003670 [Diaphorina citri]KAI5729917.1 hypothetical protein M8J76_007931 [Diaphorina citri]
MFNTLKKCNSPKDASGMPRLSHLFVFLLTLCSHLVTPLYRFTPRDHFIPDLELKDVTWDNSAEKKYFYWHLAGINSSEIARQDALPRGPSLPPYFTCPRTKRPWRPTPVFDRWNLP